VLEKTKSSQTSFVRKSKAEVTALDAEKDARYEGEEYLIGNYYIDNSLQVCFNKYWVAEPSSLPLVEKWVEKDNTLKLPYARVEER